MVSETVVVVETSRFLYLAKVTGTASHLKLDSNGHLTARTPDTLKVRSTLADKWKDKK